MASSNNDDYVVTWTGLLGKKCKTIVSENELDNFKNKKKCDIHKI